MTHPLPLQLAASLLALVATLAPAQPHPDPDPLPQAPDALVPLLTGEDLAATAGHRAISHTPASRAAAALIALKDQAVPALSRGLASDDLLVRLNILYVLRAIGTPDTLPPRIKAASDPNPKVRAQAIAGLPAFDIGEPRQTLLRALKDPDPLVRNAAIRAFLPSPRAKPPGNPLRYATATVLIPLLDDPATQLAAAHTLGHLDMNVACRPLLKLLQAKDHEVRLAAVEALGRLKDKQIAVELTAALRDEDRYVRLYAAQSLGQIADLRTTPALVQLLSDKEPFLRREAARALGEVGDLRAATALLPLLDDADEQVRSAAAEALGRLADPRAVEPLCAALSRKGSDSAAVATALGRLRDPRAIVPLTRHLLAADPAARQAADALAQIRHPDSVAALVRVILETPGDSNAGNAARRALNDLAGVSFHHESREAVAQWWAAHRQHYLRPLPDKPGD